MKATFKRWIERTPGAFPLAVLDALRALRYPALREKKRKRRRVFERLNCPKTILHGPFQGMKYLSRAYCSAVLPKLLGTYECELIPAIERIIRGDADRIIDIGAAEGYYAVGLALKMPKARIVAFELYEPARHLLKRLAGLNGALDRVDLRGECSIETLTHALEGAKRPAIVCDCEGAEDVLLDPEKVAALQGSLIVVETHDGMVPGLNERLLARFRSTHDIERIGSRPRTQDDLPIGANLSAEELAVAADEERAWAEWFVFVPKRIGEVSRDSLLNGANRS